MKKLKENESVNQKSKKSAIKIIKTFYESQEKIIELSSHYSKIESKAIYRSIHGEGLKILIPK